MKNIPTQAGAKGSNSASKNKAAIMDAIDQIFAEFDLVYHNQYSKAFPTEEKLNYAKRIWFNNLDHLKPKQIINAAHRVIRESEFLPSIKGLLQYSNEALGLPDSHSAYLEACHAGSPKAEQRWSHPAVYLAGVASDWFFLASNIETKAFPIYKRHYQILCERVHSGEQLQLPKHKAIEQSSGQPLNNEERKQRMQAMRKALKI